jgi:tetratricopeptide (TPR) repeat protein
MSDSTNSSNLQPPNQGGGGLKQSTPLVTVQNVHSGVKTAVSGTNSNMDHPLATLSPPPPPTPSTTTPSSLELSERASPTTAAAVPTLVKTTTRTPVKTLKPTVAKIPQTKTTTTTPKKQASSSSSTLEEMANDFLSVAQEGITIPPKLRPPPLPKDQEGMERLRTLVTRRAWGDVLSVCGQMLRGPTSPYTQLYSTLISNADIEDEEFTTQQKDEMVEILTLECHAWLKLRRYNELGREVDKWNFLNTKESDASIPTWVPWSLHILAAESLQYTDPTSSRSTDALYTLRDVLVEKKEHAWLTCVDNALANSFLKQKEWRLACAALDNLKTSIPACARALIQSDSSLSDNAESLSTAFQCEVLSRQGRIMLQIGALQQAAILFEEQKTLYNTISSKSSNHWIWDYLPIQIRINDGLISFAYSHYDAAMTHFRKSIDMLQSQPVRQSYNKQDWMGPTVVRVEAYSTALSNCWNNLALCALYTCRMQDAVRMMESLIRRDPCQFLTERLAFNLSTLYELGSDAAASTRKKRVLQLIAKRFYLHDIGPESFRVS